MGNQNNTPEPQTPHEGSYLPTGPGGSGGGDGPNHAAQYEAARLYNEGYGLSAFPGGTYVPMSGASQDALAQIEAIARGGNPMLTDAFAGAQQLIAGGGMSPELLAALGPLGQIANGGASVGTQGRYDALYGAAGQPSATASLLGGIADGSTGIGTGGLFADIYGAAGQNSAAEDYLAATARGDYLAGANPYLQQLIDDRSSQIANQVKSTYSGMGRYGSSTMNRDLTDRLSQFQAGVLSENYEAERARQLQAAQIIDAARYSQLAAQYQAATGRTNVEAANLGNRISAAQAIDAARQAGYGTQLQALSGYTGAQQADIGNRMGAAGALADSYAAGLNRQMQAIGAVPALDAARYNAALQLAGVGAAREADQAGLLAD